MPSTWKTPQLKQLAAVLTEIDDKKQMIKFLRDLCTIEELDTLSSRWQVVLLLEKGKTYRDIAKQTGLSTTTITRISHWLKHGEGGYQAVLKNQ